MSNYFVANQTHNFHSKSIITPKKLNLLDSSKLTSDEPQLNLKIYIKNEIPLSADGW